MSFFNKKMSLLGSCLTIAAVSSVSVDSEAADQGWWLHAGPGFINFYESAELTMGGSKVVGGNSTSEDLIAAIAEVGYSFTPNLSASFTFGYPPTAKVSGAGSIGFAGELGQIQFAPAIIGVQYAFDAPGKLKPYIGVGAVYYKVLDTKDAAITNLEVEDNWGSSIQMGLELPLKKNIGVFFDIKKLFVTTKAKGNLSLAGGAPVTADVVLDPLIFHTGISIDF